MANFNRQQASLHPIQLTTLVLLRVTIGWHFFYEGLSKVLNPSWSSKPYLLDSQGWFSDLFHALAQTPSVLAAVDILNEWGLMLIGASLILGLLCNAGAISGILLLVFYYISHAPFIGAQYALPTEGAYLIVDKNIIEMMALAVLLAFPTSRVAGIDHFIYGKVIKRRK